MSSPKFQISGPLEAGQSLLGSQSLPAPLTAALEYISSRLAKKQIALSMIVVRRTSPSGPSSPQSVVTSPVKSLFSSVAKKTLSRSSSVSSMSSYSSARSSPASPTGSFRSTASASSYIQPASSNTYNFSLINTSTLTPKEEKYLRQYVSKAEKKFAIGSGWLSTLPLTTAITCPRTNDMIRRSLNQNSVIFSSEGLTLYALDHLYTFKSQLYTYSRSLSPYALECAVDELHRLVLAQHGRRITKGYLMRAYDWMGISVAALAQVNEQYKNAYGGVKRYGGIQTQAEESRSPPPLKTTFNTWEFQKLDSMRGSRPITPNTWEELTPVTKGEWLCLMVGDGWEEKTVVQDVA